MDDKEQVPAAGDGPTQEDKANKEADAEDASEPTESEKPKKKLILTKQDRINLGKQLEPLLKPTLDSLVKQLDDAKTEEKDAAKKAAADSKTKNITGLEGETPSIRVISYSCVPTIEQLAETITDEKELVIKRRVNKEKADKAKKEREAAKEARAKQMVGYEASAARLTASFHRKSYTHLLASKYYGAEHGWLIFLPIQLIVAAIAIIAFVASYYEIKDQKGRATILTVVAGILGIVAGFLNALDRHLDWRTLHVQHQKSASLYSKLKWDIIMEKIENASSDTDAELNLGQYKEKLKQLEEHNGDLLVPIEIINCFDGIEDELSERIASINSKAIDKAIEENPDIKKAFQTKQGELLANKNMEGYIDDKAKYEILGRCYGLVTREVMRPRSCFRLPFSFKLPSPHVVVKKIIRDPKFGLALKDYSEKVESDEDRRKRELEEDCCKQCCFPCREYKSRAELVEELDQAKKDLAKATKKKPSKTRTEQPSAAAPAPAGADVGAPYSADNNV